MYFTLAETIYFTRKNFKIFSEKKHFKFNEFESKKYKFSNLSRKKKIEKEKRRRYQIYSTLDYLLSRITFYDFFSPDAFKIAIYSKYYAHILNKKNVSTDLLFLAFFNSNSELISILENFGIKQKQLDRMIWNYYDKSLEKPSKNYFFTINRILRNFWSSLFFINKKLNSKLKFSQEINKIFEKAAINALNRFKTPIITSEILFITLMEEKKTKAAKLIRYFLPNQTQWLLLRYQLIKRIHKRELLIRKLTKKNQRYFAYLLLTQLTELELSHTLFTETFAETVSIFRNTLIMESLQINIMKKIRKDAICESLIFQPSEKLKSFLSNSLINNNFEII
uniref:ClpN n=1 Tax=Neotessella volvocina TaxID=52559 RepID=A0A3G2QZX6_9STRA|nr:ClpN [Neotessella volvocina]